MTQDHSLAPSASHHPSRPAVSWALAALLMFALALPSCRRTDKHDQPDPAHAITVGVTLLTQQHDFYKDLESALREAAAAGDMRLIIHSAEFDPARQTAHVEDFITQKVNAIVICPCDSAGVGQAIRRARAAGIPVFTADIAAQGADVVAHVASDNVQGGRLAARAMADYLDGKGDVVIIDHPEVTSVQDRVRGFLEEMQQHPGIRVVDRPSAGGVREKAYAIAENMLQAYPGLRGIFAINDDSALGALRAVGSADVVIIGYDATPEARDAILRGSALKADVVQFPGAIGRKTIETLHDYLSGRPVDPIVPVAVDLIDRDALAAGSEQ